MVGLHKDRRKGFGIVIPSFWIMLFAVYTMMGFLAFFPVFGFQSMFLNFSYSVAVIILFFSVYRNEDPDTITDIICSALICAVIIISIKIVIEIQILISYFARGGGAGHPLVTSFVGGGVNLEATLLAVYSVFVIKKKYALPVFFISFLISALYASRTGFILSALVLIWYIVFVKPSTGRKNLTLLFITVPFAVIVVYFIMTSTVGQGLITRFVKTGDESGSLGRIRIWSYVADVIARYPLGVGCGNAMQAIELVSGDAFSEGNMHNMFLQITLEQGIFVGLPFLVVSAFWILRREIRIRFQDPFGVFMLLYLVQGALQSRGVDAWMAEILGLYFISRKRNWYAAPR